MKKLIAIAAAAAFGATVLPAFANETADQCKAYAQKNGTDASGCDCLGAAAAKDATLAAALARIATPADVD
ncbi:MAG: hypothetical protein K2Q06_07805, partial [Parvularculaceae bacterium]|nr:hypothetical protein [Parvularculaceae bacterium]